MTRREYSPEEKAAAIELIRELGLAEAWRRLGDIPKPTLAWWAQRAGIHSDGGAKTALATQVAAIRAEELRVQLRVMLMEAAVDLMQRMDAEHVEFKGKEAVQVVYPVAPAGAVQNYATSVAILIDKYRLETGQSTSRTEHMTLTDGMDDHERATLRDLIEGALAEPAETVAPAVAIGTGTGIR